MYDWMRRYLGEESLRDHFLRALVLGLVLRCLSAWFVFGPQALDDYKHGVWPAYQYFAGLPLEGFPEYRGHLLIWLLALFIQAAHLAGVQSALGQVRAIYFGLGIVSLTAIVGTYFFARAHPLKLAGRTALYLVAAYPLMPFVATRAFGESVALGLVTLGMGALEFARTHRPRYLSWWSFGFACLGFATLFRFQVGLIFVTYAGLMLLSRRWTAIWSAIGAGVLTLAAQALIDVRSGKYPLATLYNYWKENEGGAAKYGVSPWYDTWALALALALVPFSLLFARHLKELWRRQAPVLITWLLFVLVHSLVPHKEERFLYPILALELWAIADLWARAANDRWSRNIFSPFYVGFSVAGLSIACLVNSQEGEIGPPARIEARFKDVVYLDADSLFGQSRVRDYFLHPPSVLRAVQSAQFTPDRIDQELRGGHAAVALLTSDVSALPSLERLADQQTEAAHCESVVRAQSAVDAVLFWMNPRHNQRRRPTWYLICLGTDRG